MWIEDVIGFPLFPKTLFRGCQIDDKVENILKGSLDSIQSPSPSVKIQIMGEKVCLRCKGKTLLGVVYKLFVFKSLLTTPSNVLPLLLNQTFPPIIWIFTESEGDGIETRLPFKIFSTLNNIPKWSSCNWSVVWFSKDIQQLMILNGRRRQDKTKHVILTKGDMILMGLNFMDYVQS